jgi:hypothetical protein
MGRQSRLIFVLLVILSASTLLATTRTAKAVAYAYQLAGPLDENTYALLPDNVTVTVYFNGSAPYVLSVHGITVYHPTIMPRYFDFDLGYCHRQYWLSPNETYANIVIVNNTNLVPVTIQFQDFTGVLNAFDKCEVYRSILGVEVPIEKQMIDATKKCVFQLEQNAIYDVKLNNTGVYDYGNVIITSSFITLVVRPLDFPSDIVLAYQYVRVYGTRDFSTPTGSITLDYEDTLNLTSAFTYMILLDNGTVILPPTTFTNQSIVISTWMGAANDTGYTVRATITHTQFGAMSWNHYFPREFSSPPFSLDWMGTWPITSSAVIPAFLILFAFGSFSVLNAYVGAFFGMVTASLLSYWGWIAIPTEMLVLGWFLAIAVGIAANKRRLFT